MKVRCTCGQIIDVEKSQTLCAYPDCEQPLSFKSWFLCSTHVALYETWCRTIPDSERGNQTVYRFLAETASKGIP